MSQPLLWKSLSLTGFMQSSLQQNKLISISQKIFSALNVDEQIKRWIGGVLLSAAGKYAEIYMHVFYRSNLHSFSSKYSTHYGM